MGIDTVLTQLLLGVSLLAGGDLGLSSAETARVPEEPVAPRDESVEVDEPSPSSLPGSDAAGIALAGLAAAMAALVARGEELSPADAVALDGRPVVVFIPGHGQPHASGVFADLVAQMDLDADSTRYFDYRWAGGVADAGQASEHVPIDDAVSSLNTYVGAVAESNRPVYLVGFSKGGATVAELVADWDDGRWGPSRSVIGAALLDPPMAKGPHGWLQSLGRFWGPVPDDGGYQPVRCTFLGFGCTDRRAGLGESSGVEVVVIRNPKAGITSFSDVPRGLRVYDAPDEGRTLLEQLSRAPFGLPARVAAAHESVLHDPAVASCIVAEMRSGACDLPRRQGPQRLPSLRRPAIRPPSRLAVR